MARMAGSMQPSRDGSPTGQPVEAHEARHEQADALGRADLAPEGSPGRWRGSRESGEAGVPECAGSIGICSRQCLCISKASLTYIEYGLLRNPRSREPSKAAPSSERSRLPTARSAGPGSPALEMLRVKGSRWRTWSIACGTAPAAPCGAPGGVCPHAEATLSRRPSGPTPQTPSPAGRGREVFRGIAGAGSIAPGRSVRPPRWPNR